MAKQKSKAGAGSAGKAADPPPAPRREGPVVAFLKRYSLPLALLAVAIAVARIVSTYDALSLTTDEPGHFACGIEYLSRHVYRYESQHPPLSRAMVALLPYLKGVRIVDADPWPNSEGYKILDHTGDPERMIALMRIGVLPFFLLGCAVVYVWARRYFGGAAAFFAVAFFTLTPQVLADGGLATTDMALAACLGAAFLALLLWAESPTWGRSAILGAACALAALSKFTALGFLPAAAALAALGYLIVHRPGPWKLLLLIRARILPFVLAVAVGAMVVWAGYLFSYGEVPGRDGFVPAPEFFDGIRSALGHNSGGHLAYLFGRFSNTGWWYYFPVAIAVKTPMIMLPLIAGGICLLWDRRLRSLYLPVAFGLGVLLPSMAGRVNIGLRHVLPIYMAFAVLASVASVTLLRWCGTAAREMLIVVAVLAAMAVPGVRAHPDYVAYFNTFASSKPETVLLDSNFDWGQDWKILARRLRQLNIRAVHGYGLEAYGWYPLYKSWYGLPDYQPLGRNQGAQPDPGWTVVRIQSEKYRPDMPVIITPQGPKAVEPWYDRVTPAERVGAFLLYKPPDRP